MQQNLTGCSKILSTEVMKFKHEKKTPQNPHIKTSEYKFLRSQIILGIVLPYLQIMISFLIAQASKQSS